MKQELDEARATISPVCCLAATVHGECAALFVLLGKQIRMKHVYFLFFPKDIVFFARISAENK